MGDRQKRKHTHAHIRCSAANDIVFSRPSPVVSLRFAMLA